MGTRVRTSYHTHDPSACNCVRCCQNIRVFDAERVAVVLEYILKVLHKLFSIKHRFKTRLFIIRLAYGNVMSATVSSSNNNML